MARILIIEDDKDCLIALRLFLMNAGHEVFPMLRAEKAVEEIREAKPDLVITDLMLPGVTGGSVYEAIRREFGPRMPVIVSSGTRMRLRTVRADSLLAYCPKPVDYHDLLKTIDRLLAASAPPEGDAAPATEETR